MSGLELIARDSKSEIERNAEAATVYFSAVQNKDDDERNWSFSYLREQLLLKDSQELFRRYQVRVQHALFVELLVFNLVYNAIAFGAFIILPNEGPRIIDTANTAVTTSMVQIHNGTAMLSGLLPPSTAREERNEDPIEEKIVALAQLAHTLERP
ncbi:AC_N domain-containing protein [Trichonephila clavipes]|nr:AC_N domain-containing protein [Trichonephila clavipes]